MEVEVLGEVQVLAGVLPEVQVVGAGPSPDQVEAEVVAGETADVE